MTDPRRETIRFQMEGGRTLAADSWGDPAGQPVVLTHGGGQTRHAWTSVALSIAEHGFHAIAYDHRGHGDSDWHPEGAYDFDGFADDLEQVIEQLSQPPVLIGASLGGIVSVMVQTRHLDRQMCRGLVLVDVTPRMAPDGVGRILAFMRAHPDGFGTLAEAAEHVSAYLPHRERPRDPSGLRKNLRLGDDGRYRWHWDPRMLESMDQPPEVVEQRVADKLAEIGKLRVPMLLVRGRQSDVVTHESVMHFRAAVPGAEYVDIADAAHTVAGDSNDAFQDAVLDFLVRHFPQTRPDRP